MGISVYANQKGALQMLKVVSDDIESLQQRW